MPTALRGGDTKSLTALHMHPSVRRVLENIAHEWTGLSAGAFDLLRAVTHAEAVDGGDLVRIHCTRQALDLIKREHPTIATLWPEAFGVDGSGAVVAVDEVTPEFVDLAARARGGAGAVIDSAAGKVTVRFPGGDMLVVAGVGVTMQYHDQADAPALRRLRSVR